MKRTHFPSLFLSLGVVACALTTAPLALADDPAPAPTPAPAPAPLQVSAPDPDALPPTSPPPGVFPAPPALDGNAVGFQYGVAPPPPPSLAFAYDGSGAPPGYHYEKKRFLAPIIGGAATLGVGWLASLATAGLGVIANTNSLNPERTTNWALMAIPIAGPFTTLADMREDARTDGMTAALAIMGGAQIVGTGFLIGGLAAGKRDVLVRDKDFASTLTFAPLVSPTLGGAAVSGAF
ncbi:MAG: hypothetical protein R3F14_29295 [Polyangiaceae bacterium]